MIGWEQILYKKRQDLPSKMGVAKLALNAIETFGPYASGMPDQLLVVGFAKNGRPVVYNFMAHIYDNKQIDIFEDVTLNRYESSGNVAFLRIFDAVHLALNSESIKLDYFAELGAIGLPWVKLGICDSQEIVDRLEERFAEIRQQLCGFGNEMEISLEEVVDQIKSAA